MDGAIGLYQHHLALRRLSCSSVCNYKPNRPTWGLYYHIAEEIRPNINWSVIWYNITAGIGTGWLVILLHYVLCVCFADVRIHCTLGPAILFKVCVYLCCLICCYVWIVCLAGYH